MVLNRGNKDFVPELFCAKTLGLNSFGTKMHRRQKVGAKMSAPKRLGAKTSGPKQLGAKTSAPNRRRQNFGAETVQSL